MENYYTILGLDASASNAEIKQAYKKLAMQYHPDHNPDNPEAEERFKKLNEAYHVLIDPQKKAIYDYLLAQSQLPETVVQQYTQQTSQTQTPRYHYRPPQPPEKPRMTNAQATAFAFLFIGYLFFLNDSIRTLYSRVCYMQAEIAYQNNQFDPAWDYVSNSLWADPTYWRAYALKGTMALESAKRGETAVRCLTLAIQYSQAEHIDLYFKRGLAYSQVKRKDPTHTNFKHYVANKSVNQEEMRQMADAYFTVKDYTNALEWYKKLELFKPADRTILWNKLTIYEFWEKHNEAIKMLDQLLVLEPKNGHLLYKKALVYLNAQEIPKSCEYWRLAQNSDPELHDATLEFFCMETDQTPKP